MVLEPVSWLRLEGLAAFVFALVLWGTGGGEWWLLVPLILLPDISAMGYLVDARVGAFRYILGHTWAPGLLVLTAGVWLDSRCRAWTSCCCCLAGTCCCWAR